ncbi:hypothetical protein [Deinococcus marmoris]|uniref:Uncharacterized protein n=1 Tax=Deinococcus marmoris TaxID=249408 RepID=A0A1U7P2M4_9DEIO|nr:hypothetical protein [Deinococcus marmoris]OLV19409.1 hypothetical protein BOO71_0002983 [Deinococcus marmoris]
MSELMTGATAGVLAEILAERQRQNAKWGQQDHDPSTWLMVLAEEVGEANQAVFETLFPTYDKRAAQRGPRTLAEYRQELIQVAAVAVAAIESLDRQDQSPG